MRNHLHQLVLLVLLAPATMLAQNWGVGFRLGDPSGISVKKYWTGHAFEMSLGRTHVFGHGRYYNDHYDRWYDNQNFNHNAHEFIGYRANPALALQLHYLVHKQVKNAAGLDWYYGFGGQVRSYRYWYSYRYRPGPGQDWVVVNEESVTELDLGVDGVIGLEYNFPKAPVSIFTDATLYMELFDNPFAFRPQFGLGARFRFGG
ncbi:MAG: hypothetical protein IPM46_07450 [Flavobacteriales bacterium]|nr:hypothetical protein [Flavobacteriales bacterium]